MKNYIILTVFVTLFSLKLLAQDSKEQLAFDYFMENIFFKTYKFEKSIYVSSNLENKVSMDLEGLFFNCAFLDKSFGKFKLADNDTDELEKIELTFHVKVKFLKKPRTRKLNLLLHKSISQKDNHYVYLTVFKENHFVDHYLIKIVEDKVKEYCLVNEVI